MSVANLLNRKTITLFLLLCVPSFASHGVEAPGADEIPSIHVDQVGYLPGMKKVAILSDPQIGYNADQSYDPSNDLYLVDAATGSQVMELHKTAYQDGGTDPDSGDRVWHVDFSSFAEPGRYYILDAARGVRSYEFRIGHDVYDALLRDALKTLYYQRCGIAKEGAITDSACHLGDHHCQAHDGGGGAIEGTEVDLSGGWHDAGDFNKYVGYAYPPVMLLLSCYLDNPTFWKAFQTGLPGAEGSNAIPDILDEVKWQLDWVLKMQKADGSIRHLVASPSEGFTYNFPTASADTTLRVHEDASGQATCAGLSMLAYGAYAFEKAGIDAYAETLRRAAIRAWVWAKQNEGLLSQTPPNYQAAGILTASRGHTYGDSSGLAHRFEAACYLHLLTDEPEYLDFMRSHHASAAGQVMYSGDHAFYTHNMRVYANDAGADPEIRRTVRRGFVEFWREANALGSYNHNKTGWSAWGWNGNRSYDAYHAYLLRKTDGATALDVEHSEKTMAGVLNYIHGCNPLGFAYLTRIGVHGGDRHLHRFYHSDRQIVETPPVGYLSGGPNAGYTRSTSPPAGQPPLKSYDVTLQAPNDWEYLEGQVSYQSKYIALLASVIASYGETPQD